VIANFIIIIIIIIRNVFVIMRNRNLIRPELQRGNLGSRAMLVNPAASANMGLCLVSLISYTFLHDFQFADVEYVIFQNNYND
jgi:hypothetical protein